MTPAAVALAFFDPTRDLYGSLREGLALLFEGRTPTALSEPPAVEASGEGWRTWLAERLDLRFEAVSERADLGGASARVCRVSGTVGGQAVECFGTATETHVPPVWEELDALRAVSIVVDADEALMAIARRPRDAAGHGDEMVRAHLLSGGELLAVENARISTVYDGEGRQRNAGLELWLPGEDFPRRASGTAVAGASLELAGLRVNASIFAWRLEGREGSGAYELITRSEPPAAA